jgi:hypothetical protein
MDNLKVKKVYTKLEEEYALKSTQGSSKDKENDLALN